MHERCFRWDEGRGYSFAVYEANVPVFRHFVEDHVLEAEGDGTLFTWTVAIEPKGAFSVPSKVLSPVFKAAFGRMAADGKRYFAKQALPGIRPKGTGLECAYPLDPHQYLQPDVDETIRRVEASGKTFYNDLQDVLQRSSRTT